MKEKDLINGDGVTIKQHNWLTCGNKEKHRVILQFLDGFSNHDKRDKALERIIANLEEEGIEAIKTQITKKLTSLPSYYSDQRGKIPSSKSSGSGIFDVYLLAHEN